MDRVRWGIIGVGDVTERKSGPGFQQAERSALVAVMRRDGERARDYARRHGVPRAYDDADALIADPEVDAVYIATPPDSHCDYAVRVAQAGKPVYVEKPMARTGAECRQMLEAASGAGVPVFVAYYRRTMPRFELARELIATELGEVHAVAVKLEQTDRTSTPGPLPWRLDPRAAGGGLFVDLASHTLDWLDHVFGPISRVSGHAGHPLRGRGSAETSVAASFTFANGVLGTGLWEFASSRRTDMIEVIGTAGTLRMPCFGEDPIQLIRGGECTAIPAPYPAVVQLPLIQQITDVLTGHASAASSTGATALRTADVVDAVLADYRAEHGIVFS
ncbi:MAG: Gfo/Idh/MocA family oxidoreductase [Propioniciclava sp.]|uniref:Gfo/Idh/MocA family protein n=1 Tax=Propioniciclava sp. TaxID=2038686 RepID=UPI0039E4AE58